MKTLIKIEFATLFLSLLGSIPCFAFTWQVIGTGLTGVALFTLFLLRNQVREMYRI